ncbi:alpha/beta-Hydrolases superfamily protein [Citrus sinensis]|uniref:Alpha/beta-Hydrolases superfamily protein n=1 Tax=Citrus sinensis TaxID=2711 RepID=A0ACB8K2B1_CITSI|nr:alpha/beta-Hydrolases superfamily protein [Citrus sinensis]
MSVSCGVECVFVLGFARWMWKRCTHVGSDDSATWPAATAEEFDAVPRVCRLILAVYETDLHNPQFPPAGGYKLNPDWVVKRVAYEQTLGRAPPYLIYTDHDKKEIVLAIRGLNLAKESDYKLLLDNRLGRQMFDGGFVHHGLLKSALWLLNQEGDTLRRLWEENGRQYSMVFAGHSLGSGVAALLALVVVNHRDKLGGIPRNKVRCHAVAPARCMSLNLAVKYADVINSVILQDDFLPRTPTPLEDIFKSIFCLPCLLFLVCLRDTFIPEERKLRDPRRLYAPGRMYHIVERRFCRCGRYPPEVRTAIPVDGRFEHIVLSCNATSDHAIIWIERESQKAVQLMKESSPGTIITAPKVQKFERLKTIEKEHKDALDRAVSLNIPHAVATSEDESHEDEREPSHAKREDASETKQKSSGNSANWDQLVEKLFKKSESGDLTLNKDAAASKE